MSRPHPGSRQRFSDDLRTADLSTVEGYVHVLEWMESKDHAVTSHDAVVEGVTDTLSQASSALGALWETTRLVDRVEYRQRVGDGQRNVAHVYWLTDAGRAALENWGG